MVNQSVEYTEDQKLEFREEFKRRQIRWGFASIAAIITGSFLMVLVALWIAGESKVWIAVLSLFAGLVLVAALYVIAQNRRCPACHEALGRAGDPTYCPNCGVNLQ